MSVVTDMAHPQLEEATVPLELQEYANVIAEGPQGMWTASTPRSLIGRSHYPEESLDACSCPVCVYALIHNDCFMFLADQQLLLVRTDSENLRSEPDSQSPEAKNNRVYVGNLSFSTT